MPELAALLTPHALQSAEPVKRQPRSQCLSTLVRPVFGEVRAGVLGAGAVPLFFRDAAPAGPQQGAPASPLVRRLSGSRRAHEGGPVGPAFRVEGPGMAGASWPEVTLKFPSLPGFSGVPGQL